MHDARCRLLIEWACMHKIICTHISLHNESLAFFDIAGWMCLCLSTCLSVCLFLCLKGKSLIFASSPTWQTLYFVLGHICAMIYVRATVGYCYDWASLMCWLLITDLSDGHVIPILIESVRLYRDLWRSRRLVHIDCNHHVAATSYQWWWWWWWWWW